MGRFNAVFIHGIGRADPAFSDKAQALLQRGVGAGVALRAVHWGDLADANEKQMLASQTAAGSRPGPLASLTRMVFADATYYLTSPRLRSQIFRRMDQTFHAMRAHREPVVIFSHSLGCLIALHYLNIRPEVKQVQLVTLGCNIDLFHLDRKVSVPPQLEKHGRWLNLFSPKDALGFPVAWRPELYFVEDIPVKLGLFRDMTGLAHVGYWKSRKLWLKQIPKILDRFPAFG